MGAGQNSQQYHRTRKETPEQVGGTGLFPILRLWGMSHPIFWRVRN